MADMDTKERTGAINPEKDFHLDIAPGKTNFHVKGMDNVDWGMKDRLSRIFNLNPARIREGEDLAARSLQIGIVFDFKPQNSLIIRTRKAEHRGRHGIQRVIPLVILVDLDSGKAVGTDAVSGLLVNIRLDPLNGADLLHSLSHFLLREPQFFLQCRNHLLRLIDLTVNHGNGTDRFVRRKDFSRGIDDSSPRCLDITLSLMKILRLLPVVFRAEDHQIDEPSAQKHHHEKHGEEHQPYFSAVECLAPVKCMFL